MKRLETVGKEAMGVGRWRKCLANWNLRSSLQAWMVNLSKDLYLRKAGWVFRSSEVIFLWVDHEAIWRPRGLCDPVERASIDPSWNTDQGVKQISEFAGEKPISVMKVSSRCQGLVPAASAVHDLLWKVWARAYLFGPERWWTMHE